MKLKHFFIINAIIALAYGLGELFIPEKIMSLYGISDVNAGSIFTARLWGSALLAVGLVTAFAANTPPSEAKQAIVKALFVTNVAGFIVALIATLNGTMSAVGWSGVAIYLLLALGFGYFWFIKPEKA